MHLEKYRKLRSSEALSDQELIEACNIGLKLLKANVLKKNQPIREMLNKIDDKCSHKKVIEELRNELQKFQQVVTLNVASAP